MSEQFSAAYGASGSLGARTVDGSEIGRENLALRRLIAAYQHLSSLAIQDAGIEAVTDLIAERMNAMVAVVDAKMTVLAAAPPGGSAGSPAGFIRDRFTHPRLAQVLGIAHRTRRAVRVPGVEDTAPMIVAPIPVGDEVPAYLLTFERDEGEDGAREIGDDLQLLLTEHAATVCGLILGRERVVTAAATRVRYDLVEGLLSGMGGDAEEVLRWARHLGYDADCGHRVLSFALEDDGGSAELGQRVPTAVEQFFDTRASDAITAVRGHEVAVVLPEPEPDPGSGRSRAERLATLCLDRMRELFREAVITAGIGGLCRAPTDIARSYRDALRAVDVTRRMGRAGIVVAFEDLGIHRLLLQVTTPDRLREFAHEVLGDVGAQARGNMADYLATVSCYFRVNNSPQRASQILHVHPNTVTYRVRRVEEITKLDFGNYRDRLMAQVALEILDAVGEGQ